MSKDFQVQPYYITSLSYATAAGTLNLRHLHRFFELIEPLPPYRRIHDLYYMSGEFCLLYDDSIGLFDRHSIFRIVSESTVLPEAIRYKSIRYDKAEAKRLCATKGSGQLVDALEYCGTFRDKIRRKSTETPIEYEHRLMRIIKKILNCVVDGT